MFLDIREFKNNRQETIQAEFTESLDSLAFFSLQVEFVKAPTVKVTAFRNGNLIDVTGSVEACLRLPCARCLESYETSLTETFEGSFNLASERLDESLNQVSGNRIELNQLATESIILALPMKALCGEDCKGLCPVCGQNLNEKDCGCEQDTVDIRLDELKKLLTKEKLIEE